MKKTDVVLVFVSLAVLFLILGSSWIYLAKMILGAFLITFTLYWKLVPYKNELTGNYQKLFVKFDAVISFLLGLFKACPRISIGTRLQLESSYLIIISLIVLLLIIL